MLWNRIVTVWKGYLKGQFILTVFISGITYLAAYFTGMPYPMIITIVTCICQNIPNFGFAITIIFAAILSLIKGSSVIHLPNWQFALIVAGIFIVIELVENWLITPKLVGDSVHIHPVLVIIGMAVFSSFLGLFGLIFAVPIMATIREIIRYFFYKEIPPNSK